MQVFNRSDGKCHFCRDIESIVHLFYHCNYVQQFFLKIEYRMSDSSPWKHEFLEVIWNEDKFLLGNFDKNKHIIRTITTCMKYTIWKIRNIFKISTQKH